MDTSAKFTLRFRNRKTHELLGLVASRFGVSKNRLAEEMLERELRAASLLEQDLTGRLRLLRDYRTTDHLQTDIEAVAQAEAYEQDPLVSHRAAPAGTEDAYGIGAMFAAS